MLRRMKAISRLLKARLTEGFGLYIRIFSCFAVGAAIFAATSGTQFDTRFSVRGPQLKNSHITIITVNRDDIISAAQLLNRSSSNILRAIKEVESINDAFYWDPALWNKAFEVILKDKAKAVAITLYLGKDMPLTISKNENIFWAVKNDDDTSISLENPSAARLGRLDLYPDPDGNIRHFFGGTESLAYRVAAHFLNRRPLLPLHGQTINFQGPAGTFKTYSFSDVLKNRVPKSDIEDSVVIITANDFSSRQIPTPVGFLTTGETFANIVYNHLNNSWITEIPWYLAFIYLSVILIITIWIVFQYPESVAMVFLSFLAIITSVVSTSLFDLKNIWIPVESPLALIVITYVVITGYRLGESEKLSWKSEQELQYLSEVEALKNNFLSLISHDLKNPLAKIQGITDRLLGTRTELSGETIREDLTSIRQTSDELRQYITSLLQLTRVEARDIKLNKEVCDINSVVKDVLDRMGPLAKGKQIKITSELEPLFSMELDRTLISEVLINLVENAIKYSDSGALIEVKTSERENEVKVEVIDSAGGIDTDELPKIFDKFFRGKGDKAIKVTGTGLGLYLVKYFIELHGGSVFINSTKGVGTNIGFTLPLEAEEDSYAAKFARAHR